MLKDKIEKKKHKSLKKKGGEEQTNASEPS